MEPKVVIINGCADAGKDTFVGFCKKFLEEYTHPPAHTLSTITRVKDAMRMLGWDGEKTDAARKMMSDIKDAWTAFNDGSFHYIAEEIKILRRLMGVNLFFVHVREPEEIAKFAGFYDGSCTTVLVDRPGTYVPNNHADQRVMDYPYDVHVQNIGELILLKNLAEYFCREHLLTEKKQIRDTALSA